MLVTVGLKDRRKEEDDVVAKVEVMVVGLGFNGEGV